MPYFFLQFSQDVLGTGTKALSFLCALHLIDVGLVFSGYLLRLTTLYTLLAGSQLLLIVSLAVVLKVVFTGYRQTKKPELLKILAGILLLFLCLLLAIASYYFSLSDTDYSLYYAVGIFLFVLCLIAAFFDNTYGQMEDLAEMKAYKKIAFTDAMTGLKNRTAFLKETGNDRPRKNISCVVLDINNLKNINDTHGHIAGDSAIVDAARCIGEIFAGTGECYRMGGDEFLVVLREAREESISRKLEELQQRISKDNPERPFFLSLAYGCASGTGPVLALFEEADRKMYEMKKAMKKARR